MEIKKIIVSRTDKIGDLVLSIPSFFMLRKMFPKAEIIVLVRNYNYDIVKNLKYIDRVIKIDDYTKKDLKQRIGYFKADVFIALYSDGFIDRLARKSKAKLRIGPYSKLSSFFSYNRGIWQKRSKSIKNEAQYNLDLIESLDPELFQKEFEINNSIILGESNRDIARKFYEKEVSKKSKVIVMNPFMGGSAKNITDEQYSKIIEKIIEKNKNIEIIITAHINQEERVQKMVEGIPRTHIFPNGGPLLNIAAIIDRCDLYFGGSTGPTHIAGALGKKIIAIYPALKTQSPLRWGVFGNDKVEYLIPDLENKGEDYRHKNFDSYNEEMEEKLVNMLLKRVEE